MIPLLFRKAPLEKHIPKVLLPIIIQVKQEVSLTKAVQIAFDYVVSNWGGSRLLLVLKFNRLFDTNLEKMVSRKGYLHCTQMNYLLRYILVRSGKVKDGHIKQKLTNSWSLSPHQYLEIKVKDEILILDPWNYQFGINFGSHGEWFDTMKIMPIRGYAKDESFLEQMNSK